MKWLTYLLRHGIVVALVVGIAIAYVYRQELFPMFYEQGAEEISVASQADEGPSTDAAKDVATSADAAMTGSQDSSTTAPLVADETPTIDASKQTRPTMAPEAQQMAPEAQQSVTQPADQAAKMATTDQSVKDVQSADAGSSSDKLAAQMPARSPETTMTAQKDVAAASAPMADKGSPLEPAKIAGAGQDSAATTQGPEQSATSSVNKGSADPARMATGMMQDPLRSMSGMMQNPQQTMPGMMTPAAPGTGAAAKDSANTQAQAPAPGTAARQTQMAPRYSPAYRQQMPAPPATATMQRPEVTPQQQYTQIINRARQAYWQGQYQQSINYYQQAIKLMPESADGHGELGNVYYTQGEWDKAGESLYQSAIRLLDKGRSDKAYNMLSIIRGLRHERAAELEKRLQAQQPGQPGQ
jgi:hypothetical protein